MLALLAVIIIVCVVALANMFDLKTTIIVKTTTDNTYSGNNNMQPGYFRRTRSW